MHNSETMKWQRVAVLRALQLGDLLVAIPALRALRRGLPEARVTLIGLPWARTFVAPFCEYLDDFVEFPGWPALPERPLASDQVPAFLASCQAREFDLALQLHGSGPHVSDLVQLIGARETACFTPARGDAPPGRSVEWPEVGTEVDRCLALVRALGIPEAGRELEWPVTDLETWGLAASTRSGTARSTNGSGAAWIQGIPKRSARRAPFGIKRFDLRLRTHHLTLYKDMGTSLCL